MFTKTRIAPTPTGYLHLGNAYNFALTAALAAKHGAHIVLRIDDLDQQRVNTAYVQDIFDTLEFLQIPWHEGPRNMQQYLQHYSQVHRMLLYMPTMQQLRDEGKVFACNCSRTQVLQQSGSSVYPGTCRYKNLPFDGNAWRLDTTKVLPLSVKNIDGSTTQATLPEEMQYFVVRKKDSYPAYQLASVLDDLYFGIDCIVRGADLWPSTLAQHYLAQFLQKPAFTNIVFHHHGLLQGDDGSKLSKSAGSISIQYLRKQGKTAGDIYDMVGQMAGIGAIKSWEDLIALV